MTSKTDFQDRLAMEEAPFHDGSAPSWGMFLVGVAVTVAAFYVGFMRPASQQLAYLQRQVNRMERSMREVADQSNAAAETNTLLGSLIRQGDLVESARGTLDNIQRLHRQLDLELARVHRIKSSVQELTELRSLALRHADQTSRAHEALLALEDLQGRILDAAHVTDAARERTTALLDLESTLVDHEINTGVANENLDNLLELRDRISSEGYDLELAQERLTSLLNLKDDVVSYTSGLADAIETMESTMQLQNQFQKVAGSLDTIRGWMTEFLMLEPTIEHAMHVLEPLTELGNLSRLTSSELRQAARAVVSQRHETLAQKPAHIDRVITSVTPEITGWEEPNSVAE